MRAIKTVSAPQIQAVRRRWKLNTRQLCRGDRAHKRYMAEIPTMLNNTYTKTN